MLSGNPRGASGRQRKRPGADARALRSGTAGSGLLVDLVAPAARPADGPERVFGEWWQRDAELVAVRDYFQVEDESGDRFWIYRAGDGEDPETGSHKWFLHGVFA